MARTFAGAAWMAAALLMVLAGAQAEAQTATTTTLTVSPASAAYGSVLGMTATIAGGGTSVAGGTVTFRDTHGVITEVLGTVQVQSANGAKGTAVLQHPLSGIGNHSIVASFNGIKAYAASSSSSKSVTITGLYPTTGSLSSTGGSTGNWSLQATFVGTGNGSLAPTGSVSLLDTSNSSLLLGTSSLGMGTAGQQTVAGSTSPVTVGNHPQSVAAGDFNGDGYVDLAVLNSSDKTVSILTGDGKGGFTALSTTTATGAGPTALVAGDFDGDGKLDLAVANSTDGTISILLGNGNGTFKTPVKTYSLPPVPLATTAATSLVVGDFNGDGIPDLAVAESASLIVLGTPLNGVVNVMLGDGTGAFPSASITQIVVGILPSAVVAGDFNGDGKLDFAVTNESDNTISVLLGNGNGTTFSQAPGSPATTGAGSKPAAMVAADFNNDAVLDLAVAESGSNQIGIFKGNGDGSFTALTSSPAVGTAPLSITVGDFNSDGKVDLAVGNSGQTTASLLLGNGDLSFQTQTTASAGNTPTGIAAEDFNGDGATDLAVANSGSNTVSILLNQQTETASALFSGISIPGSGSNHLVDAAYAKDSNYQASTTNTLALASTQIKTSTLLSVSTTTPTPGQQVVITATLQPSLVGSLAPSGTETIVFTDNGTAIGSPVVLTSGTATLNTTSLASGIHSIVATYAGDTNFAGSASSPMTVTVAKATPAITWATPAAISYGMLVSSIQLNATASVTGVFTYSVAPYTLLAAGSYPITATFTPANTTVYTTATATVTLVVNPANPQINWPAPAAITYGTALSGIQLDATVSVYNQVPLSSFYNVYGIYTNGSTYSTGGFDAGASSYSSNLLGTSVTWNNITYQLGPANAPDAVSNTTISLPAGHYAGLAMLGALVNNATAANTFVVTYTDGTTASVTQSLSDWVYPLNYPGESNITCVPYRNESNGGQDGHLTCVYGYQIPLDSTRIVQSIQLPQTRNVVMLAMALVSPPVPGTLTYNPASGAVLPTGENTLSASFTPTDQKNFTSASASVPELVNPANSTTLVWATPAPITYGTALSSTQLNAVAQTIPGTTSVALSSYYRVNAFQSNGSTFSTGGFDNAGNAYSSNLLGSSIVWNGQTFLLGPANLPSAVTSTTIALPQGNFATLSLIGAAAATGQTGQTFTVTYTDGTTTTSNLSMSSWTKSASYPGETIVSTTAFENNGGGGENPGNVSLYGYQISLNSAKVVQSITLPNNRNIVIVAMSLNTSSTPAVVPGMYVYTPPAGTVPAVGTIPLSVVFTPTNTNYGSATATVNLVVGKQALLVASNSETAVYGSTVPPYSYTITGFVGADTQASSVTGAPGLTTTPATPATVNTYPIVTSLGSLASTNYSFTFANGSLTITQATPVVTWPTPASINYGTPLSTAQLNATASVGGRFTYTPATGSVPTAGTDTLSVTFTPTDSTDYASVTQTVLLKVNQAAPLVTWATPASVPYGTALSSAQLNATTSVGGAFAYTPALGAIPSAGSDTLSVTFTPTDTTDYTPVTKTVQLTVTQVTPTVTWATPASVPYGTALSSAQLNATASVGGNFAYTPALGAIPSAGNDTLSVTFTPTDATDYTPVTKTVQLAVTQVTPTITWATPASIVYGTPLSATQLNATSSVPGTFTYSPASGTSLSAGTQTLTATFTPSDTTDYTLQTATATLTVIRATLTLSAADATRPYNTANPIFTATVAGAVNGDTFTEAIATPATISSAPGAYPITPAVVYCAGAPGCTDVLALNAGGPAVGIFAADNDYVNGITYTTTSPVTTAGVTNAAPASVYQTERSGAFTYTLPGLTPNASYAIRLHFAEIYFNAAGKRLFNVAINGTPVLKNFDVFVAAGGANKALVESYTASADSTGKIVIDFTQGSIDYPKISAIEILSVATPSNSYLNNYNVVVNPGTLTITAVTPTITWAPAPITYGNGLSSAQLNASASVPGSFTYSPAAGAILAAGTQTLSATFTPTDSNYPTQKVTAQLTVNPATLTLTAANATRPYNTPNPTFSGTIVGAVNSDTFTETFSTPATLTSSIGPYVITPSASGPKLANYTVIVNPGTLTITQAAAVLSWSTPAAITYGIALSATQLNASSTVPGNLTYTPAPGTIPTAGTDTLSVSFTPTDSTDYAPATATVQLLVNQATPVITWANPAPLPYGTPLSTTQLNATASVGGTFTYSPALGATPAAGNATLSVTFTPTDSKDYTTATKTVTLVVTQATPVITWANPAAITFGATLSGTQLNAATPIAGSFAYTPAAGSTPAAGTDTLSVTFTPTDTANYTTATKTVQIVVTQATPVLTWTNPASIVYGTVLSTVQLNAMSSVAGSFAYSPAAGSIPATGTDSLTVTFTPTDASSYTTATKTVQIVVTQATPGITWATPAAITYGTALSSTQLDASSSVAGTLFYSPAGGTVPVTGTDTLTVTFTPTDTANYTTATKSVSLVVNQAVPVITWSNPASIVYGTALTTTQLNATASVGGSLTYTPAVGAVPAAGTDTLSVTFTPTDGVNYAPVTKTVQIVVSQATPGITWSNPAPISYGTTLSTTQLNATSSIAGAFAYSPAAGTTPSTGTDTLSVLFTPTDSNYTTATKTVTLVVNPAVPIITWTPPASISYGTALSSAQLNASASVPGTLTYTPAAGSIPGAGTDTLSVTFTPNDAVNYSSVTKTVALTVTQAAPVLTWATPPSIPYGTALSNTQLDASSSVAGSFVYTPAAGSIPGAGTDTLSVTFTPKDTTNYSVATQTVQLVVTQAAPAITWPTPASIVYGTTLSATQLDASSLVAGSFAYTPAAGTVPAAGTDTLSVTFTPKDTTNYSVAAQTVQLIVTQAAPAITWPTPASIVYGTTLSTTQLDASSPVAGSFVYTPVAGSIPAAGTDTLSVTFIPKDTVNYSVVTQTVQLVVTQAAPAITWPTPASIVYGTILSATQLDASSPVAGSFVYTPAAGSIPAAGTDTLSVTFTPKDTVNYSPAIQTVQLVVTAAAPAITWATPAPITYGTALTSLQLDASSPIAGSFAYSPASGSIPAAGAATLSVTFTPTDKVNYTTSTKTVTLTVNQAAPVITWPVPAAISFGTPLSIAQLDATTTIPGSFAYTPAAGSIPVAGTDTLSVVFTPTDATNYSSATQTVQLTVNQATPGITWNTPASVPFGTALSNIQLDATSPVPGSMVYTPPAGTIPPVGTDTLSVTFTPTDTSNQSSATKTVQLVVTQAVPVITWAPPAGIVYGTPLSNAQLNATASVGGTFAYSPALGSTPAAGSDTLSVTFTPTDTTDYTTVTKTVTLTVSQAAPTVTWATPAGISFGTVLSSTQLNATASVGGAFAYSPAAGTTPAAGNDTLSVTFTPTDTKNYQPVTQTVQLAVSQASPAITWPTPAAITYGTALTSAQLDASSPVDGTFIYTPAAGTTPGAGTDTLSVTFTPKDGSDYSPITKTVQLVVNPANPVLTWATPSAITFGTTLSTAQLNASASVPGSMVYTPAAGSTPAAGTDTLSVIFTPQDATNYAPITKTVQLVVNPATPVITWANPASITFGTTLSSLQLNASASVAGSMAYTPAAGSTPAAGTDTLSVTFTPQDTASYTTVTKTVQIVVTQAAPAITWATPANIVYGTTLSATQLNASSPVAGSFAYTPAAGSVPAAGTDTLSVTFTPKDTTNYAVATQTVQLVVTQAAPVLTWATPSSIPYGTALSSAQLDASASVQGAFVYTPALGTILGAGTNTLSVAFTPKDTTNYSVAIQTVQLIVTQAGPVITWATPASIVYGTALSSTQLDASSSIPGAFAYTPAAGSIPAAGTNTLSVTFTPKDTLNYSVATQTVQLLVTQAAPGITWAPPASIVYGTALSNTQLDASSTIPGTFVYTPAAGNVPAAGTDTLSVTFTPKDTTSYSVATQTVQLVVTQAAPSITWATPVSIVYGTALSTTQLDASSSIAGSFAYTPAAGVIPAAGTDTLSVTFTPTDASSYTSATKTVQLTVTPATPVITWATPASITYGTALSTAQLNASASVPGTLVYTPASGSTPAAGTDTLSVTFTPNDPASYSTVTKTVTLLVNQSAPVITWATPASIVYGTALTNVQLDASSSVPGVLVYTPAAGSIPAAGTDTLSVTFTPTDATDYATATKTVSLTVTQAAPTITWAPPAAIVYGTPLSSTQLNASSTIPGSFAYTPATGNIPAAGTDTLSVIFTPTDSANYAPQTATVPLTVTQAAPTITWATPAAITYGTALSTTQLDATASVPGSFAYTPSAGTVPAAGTDTLSVTFTPKDTTNYSAVTQTVTLTVNAAAPTLTWPTPAAITYGTALTIAQLDASSSVPGTLVYTPALGDIPPAGNDTLSVTFTPADKVSYTSATKTVQLAVGQATPVITWTTPAAITYGTTLSSTQLDASAPIGGSFVYTPAAGTTPATGTDTLSVTFTPTDSVNYKPATQTVQLTVNQATPGLNWNTPAAITYGTPLSTLQLDANSTYQGTLTYTPAIGAILPTGSNTLSVLFTPTDTTNNSSATKTVQLIVNQATPAVTWPTPSAIPYGTLLSSTQLNATSPVKGSFAYTPAVGDVPPAGNDTLSVTFTPADTTNYATVTTTVPLTVTQATPLIAWVNPAGISYGTALSTAQLNASTTVPGTLTYTPSLGAIPNAGTDTLSVTFTPNDTTNYTTATKTVPLIVTQASSGITWTNPAGIVYGTPLSATQLNAASSVAGSFTYTPASGTVLPVGTDTLSVAFTPTDTANYSGATKTVQIVVSQATPVISWVPPASISFGTALSSAQLDASTPVAGTFAYNPGTGSIPAAGTDTLSATFTPTDAVSYASVTKTVTILVTPATSSITWATPASISYGTLLSSIQLDASSTIPGSFAYTPAAGTVPAAGSNTLSVLFTPNDTASYAPATKTVQLTVTQATPAITWATPASIPYGTALTSAQLNASSPVAGSFAYTPAAGTIPTAGNDTLSVTFTPNDPASYTSATKTVQLTVTQASPVITWTPPAAITYGTPLSAIQLNASYAPLSIAGAISYSPAIGAVLNAGAQTLTATFTPIDTKNYAPISKTVTLQVNPATLTITANNATKTFDTANPSFTGSVSGAVNGDTITETFATTATTTSPVGSYPITPTAVGANLANYTVTANPGALTVTKTGAAVTISWPTPAPITYGTALTAAQLDATYSPSPIPGTIGGTINGTITGTITYSPVAGTILNAGAQTLTATFTPTDTKDYAPVTQTVTLQVNPATLTATANNATKTFNTINPAFTGTITGQVNGDTFTETFATTATANSPVGTYPITPSPVGSALANYTINPTPATLTVTQATAEISISWAPPAAITYGTPLSAAQLNASVSPSAFPGILTYSSAIGAVLNAGPQTLTATFTPTDTKDYAVVTKTVTLQVNPATLTVTANSATKTFNTTNPTFTGSITGQVNGDTFTEAFATTATIASPVGSYPITPTAVGSNLANYTVTSTPGTLTVTQTSAPVTITWPTPTPITYGTALSAAQLNATYSPSSIQGAITYSPAAGVILGAGSQTLTATFTPIDTKDYAPVSQTVTLQVNQAVLTITANNATKVYDTTNPTFNGNVTGQVNGDTFTETFATTAITASPVGTYPITPTATGANLANYTINATPGTLTVTQATAEVSISWAPPAAITYGTPLSAAQLNATVSPSSFPGVITYSPVIGTVLNAGAQTLTAAFTPTDTKDFATVSKPVTLQVNPATLTVTANNATKTFNTVNPPFNGTVTGQVNGDSFTETFATTATTSSPVGIYPITPTPVGTALANYTVTTNPGALTVTQASAPVVITWQNPGAITYGTPLSAAQLNATVTPSTIPGTLTYSPAAGTLLSAGAQTLTATFIPIDIKDYTAVSQTVTLQVNPATVTITADSFTRLYNTPNPIFTGKVSGLQGSDSISETFTTLAVTTSSVGAYTITPSPVAGGATNLANYTILSDPGTLIITPAVAPVTIAWPTPAPITYGTPLSSTQLDAGYTPSGFPGTLTYSAAPGTVLSAGAQTLTATFTPTDTKDYTPVTQSVTLNVGKAPLTVTTDNLMRAYNTPNPTLTGKVSGAVSSDSFTESFSTTAVLTSPVGAYPITPGITANGSTDINNYTVTETPGTLTVDQAAPAITWNPTASSITYGTPLGVSQLNASTPVAGSFAYTPGAGTILSAGSHPITAVFTPTDTTDYTTQTLNATITVTPATLTVTAGNTTRLYGAADPAFTAISAGAIPGDTFTFTEKSSDTATSPVGTYAIVPSAAGANLSNYTVNYINGTLTVTPVTLTVTAADASRGYGSINPTFSATAAGTVNNDAFTLTGSTPATISSPIGAYPIVPLASGTNLGDYTVVYQNGTLTIGTATLTISANSFTRLYGIANPTWTGSITGMLDGDTFAESFSNSADTLSPVGQYPITPAAAGTNLADYTQVVQNGTLSITQAPAITTMTLSTTSIAYGLNVTLSVNVASTTSGTPTGTVQFFDNGNPLATATLSNGTASYSTTTLAVGTHVILAIYSGDTNFSSSTASAASGANTITITPLDFTIQLTSQGTVEGTYGTTRQFTFHITPVGGSYPGTVQLSANQTGPILATYTFSPASIEQYGGPVDITLTVATRKLASSEVPRLWSNRISQVALGLFFLPLLGLRYSRRSSRKLTRMVSYSVLLLASLGVVGTLTGCGSGYFDHTYPITVTANSNGIQHTVSVDFHIDQSPQ